MADWLYNEMQAAAGNIRQPHLDRLRALGCANSALAKVALDYPAFGAMKVQPISGGLYEPCEVGHPALILPVCYPSHHAGLITPTITLWPVLDLIAFRADNPANWLWRTGHGWALGADTLESWQGQPVPVVATPLDWLRAGGDAVCVLDWQDDSPAWPLLRCLPEIRASDDLLARKLGQAIARNTPRPRIMVEALRHAA